MRKPTDEEIDEIVLLIEGVHPHWEDMIITNTNATLLSLLPEVVGMSVLAAAVYAMTCDDEDIRRETAAVVWDLLPDSKEIYDYAGFYILSALLDDDEEDTF